MKRDKTRPNDKIAPDLFTSHGPEVAAQTLEIFKLSNEIVFLVVEMGP